MHSLLSVATDALRITNYALRIRVVSQKHHEPATLLPVDIIRHIRRAQ